MFVSLVCRGIKQALLVPLEIHWSAGNKTKAWPTAPVDGLSCPAGWHLFTRFIWLKVRKVGGQLSLLRAEFLWRKRGGGKGQGDHAESASLNQEVLARAGEGESGGTFQS